MREASEPVIFLEVLLMLIDGLRGCRLEWYGREREYRSSRCVIIRSDRAVIFASGRHVRVTDSLGIPASGILQSVASESAENCLSTGESLPRYH